MWKVGSHGSVIGPYYRSPEEEHENALITSEEEPDANGRRDVYRGGHVSENSIQ